MSKKTCKDCLHCSIEDTDEVYCTGMPWHYPFGGSDTVSLDKEACEHFLERDEPTVFKRITASPDVLAKELITTSYDEFKDCTVYWAWLGNGRREAYYSREEAIAATVAKLKEVEK